MTTHPIIRLANETDAKQIATVHIASWLGAYRGLMPDAILDNLSLEKREQEWQDRLRAGVKIFVIENSEKIIGFASICPSRDETDDPKTTLEISAIYLLPEFFGKDFGKKLCEAIYRDAIKKGFQEIILWVLQTNLRAVRFYESQGFTPTGDVQFNHHGCSGLTVIKLKKIFKQCMKGMVCLAY